jgi:hypothetical protein
MTVYNTPSDAANTAVRSFLTSVGEHYLGRSFKGERGKAIWQQICHDFDGACAYCGTLGPVQVEHLIMFNRTEYGLHHPGNTVPVCNPCNKRSKHADGHFMTWEQHLAKVCCGSNSEPYLTRYAKILGHIAKYNYPALSEQERHAIRVIAESLYDNIKGEAEKALAMYRKLDAAFVSKAEQHAKAPHVPANRSCSICGVSYPLTEFNYGRRENRSYCRSCDKQEKTAYARGGAEAAREFREHRRVTRTKS